MKLIEIDPKKLRDNPENPRRTMAGPEADALLLANVQAVGILQPPTARERDGEVVLIAGHRRRDVAIKAKLKSIHVLIREDSDDINDALSMFREGNVLMNEVGLDLEEMVERTDFRQML